jgi:hypothetical protein
MFLAFKLKSKLAKKKKDKSSQLSFKMLLDEKNLEVQGIDPRTSRMLSERSTI